MRNKYSKNFEQVMISLAPTSTFSELLWVARHRYHYKITKDQLRQYLSKRQLKYKDYNYARVRKMGLDKPLYSERIKPDGMIQVKIAPNKWEYKQRLIYSKYHNIELTDNDYIIFLDQDRTNFDINNLKRITRRESAIMANEGIFSKNKDVTETGVLVAKLMIKSKERRNKMKDKIIRKDGVEYERKKKIKNYDCSLNIRFSREELDRFKELANKEGIKYNTLARNLIVEYVNFKSKGE